MRFDSLREIQQPVPACQRRVNCSHIHRYYFQKIRRSIHSADANKRLSKPYLRLYHRDLYTLTATFFPRQASAAARLPNGWETVADYQTPRLITLFSNLLFKGVGRHPKDRKKKGGIKVHTVIHANRRCAADIKLTSAATKRAHSCLPANNIE